MGSSTEFLASRKYQTQDSDGFVIGAWPAILASECVDTARSPRPDCRLMPNVKPIEPPSERSLHVPRICSDGASHPHTANWRAESVDKKPTRKQLDLLR